MKISIADKWDDLWGTVEAAAPNLTNVLSFVGIALAVWAVVKWIMDSRNGGAGRASKPMTGMLVFALLLTAPGIVVPIALSIIDIIINLVLGLVGGAVGVDGTGG